MNKDRDIPILTAISALFLTMCCATNALGGVSLTKIPLAIGTYTANEARAVSPDGRWVVGFDGTASLNYIANTSAGYVYDVVNQTNYCPIAYTPSSSLCGGMFGVGYRTYNGQTQLILGGGCAGWQSDWMTASGGPPWGTTRRDVGGGGSPRPCQANALAGTSSDVFYTTWYDYNSPYAIYVGQCSGAWATSSSSDMTHSWDTITPGSVGGSIGYPYGISGTGRAVAMVKFGSGDYRNYVLDWTGTGTLTANSFNGLDGTAHGWAYAVSADGTNVFGTSPVPALYGWRGYKVVDPLGAHTINQLPDFTDTEKDNGSYYYGSTPYGCTLDGRYAVGANYRGVFKAVVWDTGNADPTQWTVMDLTELARLEGVLGDFTLNLRWAYSVGTNANGLVIAGTGVDSSVNLRAFVMTVPMPPRPMLTISNSAPTGYTLSYLGFGNMTNVLEYTTNLNLSHTWTPIDTNTSGYVATVFDPVPADPQRFYRVRVQ